MNEGENPNASQSGRSRGHFGSRHYRGPSEETQYNAATNLANDPNTPGFFGDAVMANTVVPQPKKSHKGLIVGIIIAVIVIIGAIIAALMLGKRVDTQYGTKNISEAFNLFGNYMLTGAESTDPLPDTIDINSYMSYRIGYIDSSDDENEKKQYYDKLYGYYENLKRYYDEADKTRYDSNVVSDETIKYLGDVVIFLESVEEFDKETDVNIYAYYGNNGKDSTERFINNIFSKYVNSDNTVVSAYFSIKKSAASEMLNLAVITKEAGCIESSNMEKCLFDKDKKKHSAALESRAAIVEYQTSMKDYRDNVINVLLLQTSNMSKAIKQAELK